MKRKAGITLLVASGLAAVAVAATAAATSARSSAPARAQAASASLCSSAGIGFAGPVSGPAAFLGLDQQRWASTFLNFWNTGKAIPGVPAGLKRVKVKLALIGDSQLDPQKAATVGAQMLSNKSILGMIGFAGSNENLGGGPVLDRGGLVYITASATVDALTRKLKNLFRIVPNNLKQAGVGVDYALKHGKVKKGQQAMVVDDGEAYGINIAGDAQKLLQAAGVKVDRESLPESTSSATADFSSLAQKAVAIRAKLVYAPTQVASDSQLFTQQLKTAGYTGAFFATDGSFDSKSFKFPGAYVSFFGADVYHVAAAKPFVSYYTKHWGKTTPFGAPNFVAAQMLAIAISRSCSDGTTSRAEVKRALKAVSISTSILGHPVAFDFAGDVKKGPSRGITLWKIASNGTYKLVLSD
jgi:branched-chain amino acid transport system substrate-binding protein